VVGGGAVGGGNNRVKKKWDRGKRKGIIWGWGEGRVSSLSSPPPLYPSFPTRFDACHACEPGLEPSLEIHWSFFHRAVTIFAQKNCCRIGMKSEKLSASEQPSEKS